MGTIFNKLQNYVADVPPGSVFVEIGSDRYEGSTSELDRLAKIHKCNLITVDLSTDSRQRLQSQLTNTQFVIESGHQWAKRYAGPAIACLYLDNFDYSWNIDQRDMYTNKQYEFYLSHGIEMTNQNSQIEHLSQLLYLYPHLTDQAVVAFDDTYLHNGCWIGKCGPAVIYLLVQGWQILEQTTDCGVILKKVDKA